MKDYKKYLLRQLGLKESQFVPSPLREKDEHPDIDPETWMKAAKKEKSEHPQLSKADANLIAKQHLQKGEMKEQSPFLSPTARPTPVIGIAIRGSSTGGLPSGADQVNPDISPSKVGGYNRVEVNPVNSKLVDKTPVNQAISQGMRPIVDNPSTADPVTHPHQMQRTAGEEPQSATGASTDSDPTLKLKTAEPKGIDIDIQEDDVSDEPRQEEENPMIPATSLSETFERHKKLMEASLGLKKCPCGCEKGKCTCGPQCKCRKTGVCECATCGCGDPTDTHAHGPQSVEEVGESEFQAAAQNAAQAALKSAGGDRQKAVQLLKGAAAKMNKSGSQVSARVFEIAADMLVGELDVTETKKPRVCFHCKKPHPCACDKKDEEDAKLARDNPEAYRKQFGMKIDKRSDLSEGKHKAGCQCGFCKNKGSFGKKKEEPKEAEEGKEEQEEKKEQLDESYSPPFARMRGLAGLGNVVLGSNGLWENVGASQPFQTHWKMDPEKAGMVKVDEEKLKKVRAMLNRKSKRGALSDNELLLAKRLDEVLKRRSMQQQLKEGIHDLRPCDCGSGQDSQWEFDGNGIPLCRACPVCREKKLKRYRPEILRPYTQADVDEPIEPEDDSMGGLYEKKSKGDPADKRIGKMMKDPKDRPFPFDKDHNGPMRKGNEKGQLPAR